MKTYSGAEYLPGGSIDSIIIVAVQFIDKKEDERMHVVLIGFMIFTSARY